MRPDPRQYLIVVILWSKALVALFEFDPFEQRPTHSNCRVSGLKYLASDQA